MCGTTTSWPARSPDSVRLRRFRFFLPPWRHPFHTSYHHGGSRSCFRANDRQVGSDHDTVRIIAVEDAENVAPPSSVNSVLDRGGEIIRTPAPRRFPMAASRPPSNGVHDEDHAEAARAPPRRLRPPSSRSSADRLRMTRAHSALCLGALRGPLRRERPGAQRRGRRRGEGQAALCSQSPSHRSEAVATSRTTSDWSAPSPTSR